MNPLLLTSLIKGAVEIFTSKQAFKENIKSKTTIAAGVTAVAAAAVPATGVVSPDSDLQAIMFVAAGLLFLLRKYRGA